MTQKEKVLLLKDLCARLPYGVKAIGAYEEEADYNNAFPRMEKVEGYVDGIDHIGFDGNEVYVTIEGISCELSYVKPYLRSMSNMTEEEKGEIKSLFSKFTDEFGKKVLVIRQNKMVLYQDWLNSHHFDCRNLIEKGLALKAPEGMYK